MYLCFPARFLTLLNFCAMTLLCGPNCFFINHLSFVLICSIRRVKCTKCMSLLNLVLPRVPDTLSGSEEIICVVINAVATDVMFSQVLSIVEKGWKH